MCVDYTSLNSACPKDSYPLPNIDQLIDATSGHVLLSFMDAFSGYNQVKMNPADIAKTTFITHRAVYAFVMIPFGLINAGETYQKMMNTIFKSQLGRNMESYVDDMISKSATIPDHIKDLRECFDNLRKYNMKLNPEKCAFVVPPGKFLGFLVSKRGIEANPEKIKAIMEMKVPQTQKDIQKLAGCLAVLADLSQNWQKAFEEVKRHLINPPILSKAKPGEPLYLYIAAGERAVSSALIREENGSQSPALAEFVMECTFPEVPETPKIQSGEEKETSNRNFWTLYVDGSATAERSGAGLILFSPGGFTIQQAITFAFKSTNNQAEYEALLSGLRLAKSLGVRSLTIYSDSQIKQINREENAKVDELSKLVQNTSDLSSSVYFEELGAPNTDRPEVLCVSSPDNWMTPYIAYLKDGTLSEDQNKARYLRYNAAHFFLEDNQLYRRTFSAPTLKCVDPDEAEYYLREVHEGICGDHLAAKALSYKVFRQGYYWPTIHADAVAYVKKCSKC
ncbi:uncharacterized protein LOC141679723 [Apium graveolens]|uniref:uncharacterized protein LOC141679723 n=1 Tax=Apium graveolens TaxID=4045 RepID=UPI003D7989EC